MSEADAELQRAEALDRFLSDLQSGASPSREALVAQYPELASALDCLEQLDQLVPPPEPAAPASAAVPAAFGPYLLMGEIGRGGMGVVYKARQTTLDRLVAIKMILASHLASAEHVRRFQAEARAAARVRHPNIVHIHEVGQEHGQHYFVMEYVEGQSLAQRLASGPMPARQAASLLATVARAVDHLHRQGVVHRDLKPSNILLDAEGIPCVTDFGLAKVFAGDSQATATAVVAGTPAYMSPEQAAGHTAEVGPSSDIYSLGAILYELLAGRPPFCEENPIDTLLAVLGNEPEPPSSLRRHVPRELEMICLKCLSKRPSDRYTSAADLADDLERFVRDEPVSVRPPGIFRRVWRWSRRQPALASRMGALALFYTVEWVNYVWGNVDADFHRKISIIVLLWALASLACQQFLDNRRWSSPASFVWGTFDAALLLAVLLVGGGLASPLMIGYPLLISAAGLWFRVRFVWYITGLSVLSYGLLLWDLHCRRPELKPLADPRVDRDVIFLVGLILLGSLVSYLVHRVRALSAFYGQRIP